VIECGFRGNFRDTLGMRLLAEVSSGIFLEPSMLMPVGTLKIRLVCVSLVSLREKCRLIVAQGVGRRSRGGVVARAEWPVSATVPLLLYTFIYCSSGK
jgi:hypothetical protein